MIAKAELRKLFPSAKTIFIDAVVRGWPKAEAAGINNARRVSQFLSNIGVETGGLSLIAETLNYSVDGLLTTFGRHRISEADARRLGRKKGEKALSMARQRDIGNIIYGGAWGRKNLGNTQPNDGWEMRGKGMMQTTGRANHAALGFADNPAALLDPDIAFETAVREWAKRGCNKLADAGETAAVRKRINGGANGLKEVRAYLSKALAIFADFRPSDAVKPKPAPEPAPRPEPQPEPTPAAEAASFPVTKELIRSVQKLLFEKGYTELGSKDINGEFDGVKGKWTDAAILASKSENKFEPIDAEITEPYVAALPGFPVRKYTDDREKVTPGEVAATKPEARANWWGQLMSAVSGFFASIAGIVFGVLQYFGAAKKTVDQLREYASDVPGEVYLIGMGVIMVGSFLLHRYSLKKTTEAVQTGERR